MNPDAEHAQMLDDDDFVYTRTVDPSTKEVKVWSGGYRIRSPLLESIFSSSEETPRATIGGKQKNKPKKGSATDDTKLDAEGTDAAADVDADADAEADTDPKMYAVPFGLHVVMASCAPSHSSHSMSNPLSALTNTFQRPKHIDDDLFDRLFALSQFATTTEAKTARRRTLRAPRSSAPAFTPSSASGRTTRKRRNTTLANEKQEDADEDEDADVSDHSDSELEEEQEEEQEEAEKDKNKQTASRTSPRRNRPRSPRRKTLRQTRTPSAPSPSSATTDDKKSKKERKKTEERKTTSKK